MAEFAQKLSPVSVTDPVAVMLNDLARAVHGDNLAKGFGDRAPNVGEALMLMVTELAEAMEADRKQKPDDHLPHRGGVEVELADCLIRILDFAGGRGLDLGGAVVEKIAYNRTRPYKHGKNY